MVAARRLDILLVRLDPTRGSEIQKTRPCVVISPDELNAALRTVVVAPMTTGGRSYPWRIPVEFDGRRGHIALDQIRTIDLGRIIKPIGRLDVRTAESLFRVLGEMFAP